MKKIGFFLTLFAMVAFGAPRAHAQPRPGTGAGAGATAGTTSFAWGIGLGALVVLGLVVGFVAANATKSPTTFSHS